MSTKPIRRILAVVAIVALAVSGAIFVTSDPAESQDDTVTMTLLHNNDGESKLLPDPDGGFPGIARFTATLQELGTATDADILLRVTSGDNFLASKEFSAGLARDGEPLYDSVALSGLYEVMGLGNHDFDFGPDVTARFIEGFSPTIPFLAANIDVSGEPVLAALADEGRIAKSVVITDPTSEMAVGVIGALTPRLPNISSPRGVTVSDDVAGAINAEVAALNEQGVDRIVLVSHLQGLTEDQDLIPALSGVDIVVAGGGDELLANDGDTCQPDEEPFGDYPWILQDADGNDVPVVTAPGGYRCIGQLDVTFDGDGNLIEWTGSSIGVPLDGASEAYARDNVEAPLTAALADLEATIIGSSDVDLDGQRSSVRTGASNQGELMADSLLAAGQSAPDFGGLAAQVAIQNGGGIRNDSVVPAGELSLARTFDMAPFANFAVTMEVPRERFRELLELGVSGLPEAEGRFPQIAGFTMEVDASAPARDVNHDGDCELQGDPGSRVQSVVLDDGTVIIEDGDVVPGDPVVLATIDFLAGGGDCYPLSDIDFTKVGVSYQQALANLITGNLGGNITADAYPAGGSRTTITGLDDATEEPAEEEPAEEEPEEEPAEEPAEEEPAEEEPADDPLPETGSDAWLWTIGAVTAALAGAMVWFEARRSARVSLANRLRATEAWFPNKD